MSAPPVPPRPFSSASSAFPAGFVNNSFGAIPGSPPPRPPLPPGYGASPPHFESPLVAPRAHKLNPDVPANMARQLDDQIHQLQQQQQYNNIHHQLHQLQSPPPLAINTTPTATATATANWSPWLNQAIPAANIPLPTSPAIMSALPLPYPGQSSLSNSMANLSFTSSPTPSYQPQKPPSPPASTSTALTATLPSIPTLLAALPSIQLPNHDPNLKIAWCRDVIFLVDHLNPATNSSSTDPPSGPVTIADPQLAHLASVAVPTILQLANTVQTPLPLYAAEALYLRATLEASGAHPQFIPANPRSAFRDFEAAARAGYAAAWFRLGRDYENFNDITHARDCFERGVKLGVESCAYRMGMAHLMGQLGLPPSPENAVPLLHRAATLASLDCPQPAYVYCLLLLGEFSRVTIPPSLFTPYIPPASSHSLEARKHLERAAYLNFAPAQYKLGHAYEFAQPPFPFDALLSVQYYSLASQQGEVEADMALSKWFLCGSGEVGVEAGGFEKDEQLAWTFADKAAKKGLPSAEFAMGYYAEVGVGGPKDVQAAIRWYTLAKEHGNADATERLSALSQPLPQALSRQEHDTITETKLIRKRTQARQRSDTVNLPLPGTTNSGFAGGGGGFLQPGQQQPYQPPMPQPYGGPSGPAGPAQGGGPRRDGRQVVDMIRKNSIMYPTDQGPTPAQQYANSVSANNNNTINTGSTPRPRPQRGGPPQAFPQANRYTLTDAPPPGAGQGPPPNFGRGGGGRTGSPAQNITGGYGRGGRRTDSPEPQQHQAPPPKKSTGPTTFAQMGIQGAKAEKEDCVIM